MTSASCTTGSKLVYLGGLPGAAGADVRELSSLQMPTLTWDAATGHRAQLQGHAAVAVSRAKLLTFGYGLLKGLTTALMPWLAYRERQCCCCLMLA